MLEAVQMLRGLVADPEAPAGARVRAATALMDRAGLTPAYAVERIGNISPKPSLLEGHLARK